MEIHSDREKNETTAAITSLICNKEEKGGGVERREGRYGRQTSNNTGAHQLTNLEGGRKVPRKPLDRLVTLVGFASEKRKGMGNRVKTKSAS